MFFLCTSLWGLSVDIQINHSKIILLSHAKCSALTSVKCMKLGCWDYPSLTSVQYSCPCLLPIQVSRLPFPARHHPLLSICHNFYTCAGTFFLHPKLPPVRFCQLPKGFKQLLLIFTLWHLLQRDIKRVNNESDDGGGSDGRSLWLDQQASRGGGWRPQLEVCPRLPGAKFLDFSLMLMLMLMLIMRLRMLNPILTLGVPNWRCVPGYQV